MRIRERVSAAFIFKLLLCTLAATATVIACGWIGAGEQSVRFNSYRTEREMGRLPPLPTLANGLTELSAQWMTEPEWDDPVSDYGVAQRREKETDELWERADAASTAGEFALARSLLREYLARTNLQRDAWFAPVNCLQRRNSAVDQLDALAAYDKGASLPDVQAYLEARRAYDSEKSGEEINHALDAVRAGAQLADNVAYLRAATSANRQSDYASAALAFKELAARYPQSEKREAALFMSAVATMKTSSSFTGTSGDEAHLRADDNQKKAGEARNYSTITGGAGDETTTAATLATCCDDAWREALAAFNLFLSKYPRGRYASDARGWIAYLLLRGNDRAGALVNYYRLLGDEEDRNAQLEAAFSLTLVRHHATEDEMKRVEAKLEDEPRAALAYAYHEIYNYLINPGCQLIYDWPENDWEAEQQEHKLSAYEHAGLERVAAFGTRLMRRYPKAGFGGSFALRVASANLELGENHAALEQSRRALSLGVKKEERERALWVKGVAEQRLRDYDSARRTLSMLVAENSQGELTTGARRLLAMVAEDAGDLDAALEQYMALKYDTDVAYFIDVLLTPEQLAGFIERRPDFEKRDEFLYALGIRYMRLRRWDEARAVFASVKTAGKNGDRYSYGSNNDCYQPPGFEYRCFDPKDTDNGPGVTSRLILSDIRTIDDLQRLERAAEEAQGDEAKAEALYQEASYLFQSSTLLFHNPIAWGVGRHYELAYLQSENKFRAPGEAENVWRDMQEHEPVARALVIYLEVARRYPRTRAARDALYTAAVCHERLSNYNEYWSNAYRRGQHAGDRMVTYADVKAAYPNYQLPRGTYLWEPVTRTVKGGPGWAAPPKPKPRLTFRERLKLHVGMFRGWIKSFWEDNARRWVIITLAFLSAFFASYLAGRARKLLRQQFQPSRPGAMTRRRFFRCLSAHRRGKLMSLLREESKLSLRRARRRLLRLMLTRRGRNVLALNLSAHALLILLLIVMAQTMAVAPLSQ
jgi:TolA-binding protein